MIDHDITSFDELNNAITCTSTCVCGHTTTSESASRRAARLLSASRRKRSLSSSNLSFAICAIDLLVYTVWSIRSTDWSPALLLVSLMVSRKCL